jgi:TonB family protein
MTTPKSGSGDIGLTGPALGTGGTAGHLPAGHALREFQIERVLGEGGFSVVYLATDTRLERQVAIKEYMPTALATRHPDLSVQVRSSVQHREAFEAGLRSFINEAKLLARFEHRALVKVHQFWQEKGTAYMVMPHYAGPTLKNWVRQQRDAVDPTWLEQFLRLVMDALETLHRENCLHRDVAPDNILILNERAPLLLDFGAARRVIGDITQALTVILKPGFAPIEQYAESQSMRQGPWTDVYALCAVAHFMIIGRAPTPSVTRVLADDLVPLGIAAAGRFPPAFLAALDAGLTVRPQQRPQSVAALRELMNGTAPEDNTLTAPPGVSFPQTDAPLPTTQRPLATAPRPDPTVIRPLTPIIPRERKPADDEDDDKTRIAPARNFGRRPSPGTLSSPPQPAEPPGGASPPATQAPSTGQPIPVTQPARTAQSQVAADAADAVDATDTADSTDDARVPSRSLREHDPTAAQANNTDDERASLLPLLLGGLGIALVIGAAWFLINRMSGEMDTLRTPPPPANVPVPAPAPAPAPRPKAAAPEPTQAAQATPAQSSPSMMVAASTEVTSATEVAPTTQTAPARDEPASTQTAAPPQATLSTPTTPSLQATTSPQPLPSASESSPATMAAASGASAAPTVSSTAALEPPAMASSPSKDGAPAPAIVSTPPHDAPTTPATQPAAKPAKAAPKADTRVASNASTAPRTGLAAAPDAASKGGPAPAPDARTGTVSSSSPSKSGAPTPSNNDGARPRLAAATPAATAPAYEPQVAPPVTVSPVTTVDVTPPPVAAVEPPPRSATPPAAAALPAPLRAINRPEPIFPREARRADVDRGKVRARLFVGADGRVGKVEILSAQPARVFDREVRETTLRWRFEPPGQPRQTDVEFVFDRTGGP